jgi:NTP pyrophosphatase (non-canonical NTP hydrolase)
MNTLKEYQKFALSTAVYPKIYVLKNPTRDQLKRCKVTGVELVDSSWIYPLIGLIGEAGELANIMKKVIRDKQFMISHEIKDKIISEKGDISWYDTILDYELDIDPDEKIDYNINKLSNRMAQNKIHDDGKDNRDKTQETIPNKMSIFMSTIRKLEGKTRKPVPKATLIKKLIQKKFKPDEAQRYITFLERQAVIYESRTDCYNVV